MEKAKRNPTYLKEVQKEKLKTWNIAPNAASRE
jgi:hypothetical protein